MIKYFKITNEQENHHGFQYKDGLNVLIEPFNHDSKISEGRGGFYITNLTNLHKYYRYGCWVREVILPTHDADFKMVTFNDDYRVNKLILGKKWPLFSCQTINKLKLTINYYLMHQMIKLGNVDHKDLKLSQKLCDTMIDQACIYGHVEVLDWWVEQIEQSDDLKLNYTHKAIDIASASGHIEILNWWAYKGRLIYNLELKYTNKAIDDASVMGLIEILNWWETNSYLGLKYTNKSMDLAKKETLDWWVKSRLKLKYTDTAMNLASNKSLIGILDWWLASKLPLKYSVQAMHYSLNVEVLNWWVKSGLKLKYTDHCTDFATLKQSVSTLDWWDQYNSTKLIEPIKYPTSPIEENLDYDEYPTLLHKLISNGSIKKLISNMNHNVNYDEDDCPTLLHRVLYCYMAK